LPYYTQQLKEVSFSIKQPYQKRQKQSVYENETKTGYKGAAVTKVQA